MSVVSGDYFDVLHFAACKAT